MHHIRFQISLLALLIVSFTFASQATSGTGGPAVAHLPLLAANQAGVMIQVSSFQLRKEAESESARLKSMGVDASIRHESVRGKGKWYRVYAGQFETKSQARNYAHSLKKKGVISWFWVKTVNASSAISPTVIKPQRHVDGSQQAGTANRSKIQKTKVESTAIEIKGNAPEAPAVHKNKMVLPEQEEHTSLPANAVTTTVAAKSEAPEKTAPSVQKEATRQTDTDPVSGWDVRFKSQTTLRTFERDTSKGQDTIVLPLYQYLQLDIGDAEAGGWGMHLYGWGRKDFADSDYFEDDPDGDLVYGYIQYVKPYSRLRVNLGRQHIFSGVTNESVDGLRVETGLGDNFSASIYGGLPAAYNEDGRGEGQSVYGGRLAHHFGINYELGLSYQSLAIDGEADIVRAGADLLVQTGNWFSLNGLSSFNLESEDWREHNYNVRLQVEQWALEPAYQYFQYRDYFDTTNPNNSIFTFLKDSDETLSIAGADLLWKSAGAVEMGLRGRSYAYDVREESAQYLAGLLTINFSGGSQIGAELGRMDGETPENIYGLYRGYFHWQDPIDMTATSFISGDVLYVAYDAPVFGEDSSSHYSMGAGRTFFNNLLETKLSIIYSQDPFFESDFGGVLTFLIDY